VRVSSCTYLGTGEMPERADEGGIYEKVIERQNRGRNSRECEEAPAYRQAGEEVWQQRQLGNRQSR
jgi:hypothetical protein